jgi:hypothetical protein
MVKKSRTKRKAAAKSKKRSIVRKIKSKATRISSTKKTKAPKRLATTRVARAISVSVCQGIVYAETGTIEAKAEQLTGLAEARRFIAGVAYKRDGTGVAKPKYPSDHDLQQPFIKRAWDRCSTAANDAQKDDVGDCKHFVIWYSDDNGKTPSHKPTEIQQPWPYDQSDKIKKSWGPYKVNELNGSNIYVFKYCGVP